MKLFVGNLPHRCSENEVTALFETVGSVVSTKIIIDRATQKSKGYGFVEMSSSDEGTKAIDQLNGKDFQGRNLVVNEARPQEKRERSDRPPQRRPFR